MLTKALKRCIRTLTENCPEDDMEARTALGVLDVLYCTLGSAGIEDIQHLRRKLGVRDPKPEEKAS